MAVQFTVICILEIIQQARVCFGILQMKFVLVEVKSGLVFPSMQPECYMATYVAHCLTEKKKEEDCCISVCTVGLISCLSELYKSGH